MLAHNIKEILSLVPEAGQFIKQASLWEEFPVGNVDSCLASMLEQQYLIKVAKEGCDYISINKVNDAARMYGLDKDPYVGDLLIKLASFGTPMIKQASEDIMMEKQAELNLDLGLVKTAEESIKFIDNYGSENATDKVMRYGCSKEYVLDKQASVLAMQRRYESSGDVGYIKAAEFCADVNLLNLKRDDLIKIANVIVQKDVDNDLDKLGFDFFKECLTKSAAEDQYSVMLAGKSVPLSTVMKFGKANIAAAIGSDVAAGLTGDASVDKQILETLPRDLQVILARHLGCM